MVLKFHTFSNLSNFCWPFRRIGRFVNKNNAGGRRFQAELPKQVNLGLRRERERFLSRQQASSSRITSGGRRLSILNIEMLIEIQVEDRY